jgi:hypothetical protein
LGDLGWFFGPWVLGFGGVLFLLWIPRIGHLRVGWGRGLGWVNKPMGIRGMAAAFITPFGPRNGITLAPQPYPPPPTKCKLKVFTFNFEAQKTLFLFTHPPPPPKGSSTPPS